MIIYASIYIYEYIYIYYIRAANSDIVRVYISRAYCCRRVGASRPPVQSCRSRTSLPRLPATCWRDGVSLTDGDERSTKMDRGCGVRLAGTVYHHWIWAPSLFCESSSSPSGASLSCGLCGFMRMRSRTFLASCAASRSSVRSERITWGGHGGGEDLVVCGSRAPCVARAPASPRGGF